MVSRQRTSSSEDELWQASVVKARLEREFWDAHYAEFVALYPEQFVAVQNGRVVASSDDLRRLVSLLDEQSLNPRDLSLKFIHSKPVTYIL